MECPATCGETKNGADNETITCLTLAAYRDWETGDFLGKERQLAIKENDVLAVMGAGAYGFVMSSNYNSRGRAAEVMVDADQVHLIRERESIESLWERERLLP